MSTVDVTAAVADAGPFVDALPRTLIGTVQRFRLREPAAARGA